MHCRIVCSDWYQTSSVNALAATTQIRYMSGPITPRKRHNIESELMRHLSQLLARPENTMWVDITGTDGDTSSTMRGFKVALGIAGPLTLSVKTARHMQAILIQVRTLLMHGVQRLRCSANGGSLPTSIQRLQLKRLLMFAIIIGLLPVISATRAKAAGLNDTGQTQCYDASNPPALAPCSATLGGDSGTNPRQDARFGRDAQIAGQSLTKVGAGAAAFDYTKIANNGAQLAPSGTLGTSSSDWACTKDNVTGLTWEVKNTSGPRNVGHTYTWYSAAATTNGGSSGAIGTNTSCASSLATCNLENYVSAQNAATLCGASDWRLPTRKELLTLVYAGKNASPYIDTTYFPNTTSATTSQTWTGSTHAFNSTFAWYVDFYDGNSYASDKFTVDGYVVRLVRGGQ